jgi:hypothetical protein
VATVATKVASLFRKRGVILLAISAISALLAAKGQPPVGQFGFWDGPA